MATLLILRRRKQRALRRERVFRDRLNVLESMDDIELINRYRFPRHVIIDIVSKVEGYVTRPTRRVHAIPTHIQVLVTLRFLAKADFFSEVGDLHGISRSSVCRIIHTVCQALNVTLDNIGFPVEATAMRDIKTEFHQIARIPNCVGAVDGTLIPIKGVSGPEEPAYVCRKNFHALNIQAVADARMRFLHLNACFPGSTHDAYVLSNSGLPDHVQSLPDGGWLLGDSGYPLKPWLLTPFQSPRNQQEQKFNDAHSKTRVVVERSFGVLKARFRCLHQSGGTLPFSPIKCSRVIEACFRLHNVALRERIPLRQEGRVVLYHHNMVFGGYALNTAQQMREQVANLL